MWVGSGFGGDNVGKGGVAYGAEGELGCSDVPGWEDGQKSHRGRSSSSQVKGSPIAAGNEAGSVPKSGGVTASKASAPGYFGHEHNAEILGDDGTDDHLHHPLPASQVSGLVEPAEPKQRLALAEGGSAEHADIQSLQETAEIAGKVALLSRGGCGFLEKVKWAQRRGAAALIIGDDTRGGALVTMYARGDTSNITIPSLFTSHTTAHLLSSLIPPESFLDSSDPANEDNVDITQANEGEDSAKQASQWNNDRPTFTPIAPKPRATSARSISPSAKKRITVAEKRKGPNSKKSEGWLRFLFGHKKEGEDKDLDADSRRPPSSGRLNWINEKWDEETATERKANVKPDARGKASTKLEATQKPASQRGSGDGFEIGIQDWRDPDLVATKATQNKGREGTQASVGITSTTSTVPEKQRSTSKPVGGKPLSGGSITPGSGEYGTPGDSVSGANRAWMDKQLEDDAIRAPKDSNAEDDEENWLSHVLWGEDANEDSLGMHHSDSDTLRKNLSPGRHASKDRTNAKLSGVAGDEEHEGLWVTLSPTTMSTTPFFDTLLVLVISPLVTLTVVYALLLIRSRIRRRRWRAPKSVVEQLPVRTYQTMSASSTTSSIRVASPLTSSPTSPLLQTSPRPVGPRSRPRSRTMSGVGDELSTSFHKPMPDEEIKQEKPSRRSASKRRYKGKQVECVVCLEEYVEGHSQVMSLPCGHEFHADCITPWLTTRRRTCPICKNDVVRSLAHSSSAAPSPSHPPYQDEQEGDDVQVIAAESTNESPSAAIPIPGNTDEDLERGEDMAETLVEDQSGRRGWRGLGLSLSAFSGEAAWRQEQANRNR